MSTTETSKSDPYLHGYILGTLYYKWMEANPPEKIETVIDSLKWEQKDTTWKTFLLRKGFREGYHTHIERITNMTQTARKPQNKKTMTVKARPVKPVKKVADRKLPYHNKVTFSGNLGRDTEFSYTPSGKGLIKASMAIWLPGAGKGNDNTQWVELNYWLPERAEDIEEDALATVFYNMNKGDKVVVTGALTRREFNGNYYYGITVTEISYNVLDGEEE